MDSEGVSLPKFHHHLMKPYSSDLRKGDCCRRLESVNDGFHCQSCDVFIHKKCVEAPECIQHPSHSIHFLRRQSKPGHYCDLCGTEIRDLCYRCEICDFDIDLYCVTFPPPEVIDISETHHHKLTLLKKSDYFKCICGKMGYGFPYKCHECDLAFHVPCNNKERSRGKDQGDNHQMRVNTEKRIGTLQV